jgi:hypothetical protein
MEAAWFCRKGIVGKGQGKHLVRRTWWSTSRINLVRSFRSIPPPLKIQVAKGTPLEVAPGILPVPPASAGGFDGKRCKKSMPGIKTVQQVEIVIVIRNGQLDPGRLIWQNRSDSPAGFPRENIPSGNGLRQYGSGKDLSDVHKSG